MKLEIVFKDGRKENFDSVASFNVTEEQTANEKHQAFEVAQTPTEGKLFEVNPMGIDRSLFEKTMEDRRQELTRDIIQEAFAEVDKHPEKYASPFYTLIPEKNWEGYKTALELKAYAEDLGDHMTDWVEQALEWAQRIANGECWENIYYKIDKTKYRRMIVWKNGFFRFVGGSCIEHYERPASYIDYIDCTSISAVHSTVPLVTLKKK